MPQPPGNMSKGWKQSGDEALAPCDHTHHHLPALLSLSFSVSPSACHPQPALAWVSVAPWVFVSLDLCWCLSLCVSAPGACLLFSWALSNQDLLFLFPSCFSSILFSLSLCRVGVCLCLCFPVSPAPLPGSLLVCECASSRAPVCSTLLLCLPSQWLLEHSPTSASV